MKAVRFVALLVGIGAIVLAIVPAIALAILGGIGYGCLNVWNAGARRPL
ncbi:hypothetical protein ACQ858_19670 [Variovorax ureilyticus]